jgi:DNA polymerase-1
MLQLSLILMRISRRGRITAGTTYPAFVSHYSPQTRQKSANISIAARNINGDQGDDPPPPRTAVVGKRKIHQSRLASIYDEMFADDDNGDSKDTTPITRSPNTGMAEEEPNFREDADLQKNSGFELDNDYPQDLGYEITSKTSIPTSFPKKEILPPKAESPITKPQFVQPNAKPSKARMFMGREMPPSVSEYDNSHYDEEFGAAKYGENEYMEFHDGMLEELDGAGEKSNAIPKNTVEERSKNDSENKASEENVTIAEHSKPKELKFLSSLPPSRTDVSSDDLTPPKNWVSQTKLPPRPVARASISEKSSAILRSSANGSGGSAQEELITVQLAQIEAEIYGRNKGKEFNIKSPKQVSMVLYGNPNESTDKSTLEALTGNISNIGGSAQLAALILKHRKHTRDLKRIKKEIENKENGIHVASVKNMRSGKEDKVTPSSLLSQIDNVQDSEREPLVLIDASAYIFRAYYSMPPMHRHDGEPTGATLGFCNMLNKLVLTPMLNGEQPRVVLVFDSKDGTNFRKKLFPEYKGNRKPCPEDLIPQFEFVREAADAYGILQLEAPGFEADDVIATLSTMAMKEECHVNILSGDKDLMQLVTKDDGGACIEMIDPMKMVRFCHDAVTEKWGVEPEKLGDVLALAGDSADNIPGVPSIGPKIAASLIQEFGSLNNLLENLDEIKQKGRRDKLKANIDMAVLSRNLVELERNVPLDVMSFPKHVDGVSDFRMEALDKDRLLNFYEKMGFRDLKDRAQSRLPKLGRQASPTTDKYSSIVDDVPASSHSQKGNGFSSRSNFKAPPKLEDFPDVPF